nr:hypothetical protein [Nannocystis pusilla]
MLLAAAPAYAYSTCNGERASPATNYSTSFAVTNRSSSAVDLYWLDFQGQRTYYATINPGSRHWQQTYYGHIWVVTTLNGDCLIAFVGPSEHQEFDVY